MAWSTSSTRCRSTRRFDPMDLKLTGKNALISGSTLGIGHAIAASLAREGAKVIVNGRTSAAVEAAVAEMKKTTGGDVVGFAGDLSGPAGAAQLVRPASPVGI